MICLHRGDAGLHLEIRNGYLLIKDVPYVTASSQRPRERRARPGKLETEIVGGHERTKKLTDHVAYWIGEHPCHANGEKIRSFENPSNPQDFGNGVKVDFTFSAKSRLPRLPAKEHASVSGLDRRRGEETSSRGQGRDPPGLRN